MKKVIKLKICDWSLLFLSVVIFASGLQLEINPGGQWIWVWLHIIVGVILIIGIFWHVGLHKSGREKRQPRSVRQAHKDPFLGLLFALTLFSGIIAIFHWIGSYCHTTAGGIHGKAGFLFIIAIINHIRNYRRFYKF